VDFKKTAWEKNWQHKDEIFRPVAGYTLYDNKTNEEIWEEPKIYMKLIWTYRCKRTQCVAQLKKKADQGGGSKQHPWRWNKTWMVYTLLLPLKISSVQHYFSITYRQFHTQVSQDKKSATTYKKTNNPVQIVGSSSQRFLQSFDACVK